MKIIGMKHDVKVVPLRETDVPVPTSLANLNQVRDDIYRMSHSMIEMEKNDFYVNASKNNHPIARNGVTARIQFEHQGLVYEIEPTYAYVNFEPTTIGHRCTVRLDSAVITPVGHDKEWVGTPYSVVRELYGIGSSRIVTRGGSIFFNLYGTTKCDIPSSVISSNRAIRWSKDEEAIAEEMRQNGASLGEIAARLGRSINSVKARMK